MAEIAARVKPASVPARELSQGSIEEQEATAPEPQAKSAIAELLRGIPNLETATELFEQALDELKSIRGSATPSATAAQQPSEDTFAQNLREAISAATALNRRLVGVSETAHQMFYETDFTFLYDHSRKLFSIGFRVTDGGLDPNCYDLLASEARIT